MSKLGARSVRRRPGAAGDSVGRGVLMAVVLALVGGGLAAQEPGAGGGGVTLEAAVRAALAAHPAGVAARAGEAAARERLAEARGPRLPWLGVEGGVIRHQEPMLVAPLHGFDPSALPRFDETLVQASLTANWTLFDGGVRSARVRRAESMVDGAAAAAAGAEQELIARTVGAYARVRAARAVLAASEHLVTALEAERRRVAQLHEEGRVARVALLRAESALSGAAADRIGAAGGVALAEGELARLIGASAAAFAGVPLQPVRWAGAPDPAAATLLAGRALAASPEVARAASERRAAAAAVAEARGAFLPRIQGVGRFVEYGSGGGDFVGEWQGGVQFSYPLLAGGARSGALRRAEAEERVARAQEHAVALRVEESLERSAAVGREAAARSAAYAQAVAQLEEVVRIERLSLQEGVGVQSDYLRAEADLFRARAAWTEAEYRVLSAGVELGRVAGNLSLEWLATRLETGS
jgi:outer membrane protein